MDVCTCGHAQEEHGGNPDYPGSTACTGEVEDVKAVGGVVPCDCICYEEDEEA